jgi:hypothetical protein
MWIGGSIVRSETVAGDELLGRLESEGMPAGLAGMGFAGTGDLWPPWCAALWDGAVASVAQRRVAERLGLRLLGPTISVP